MVLCNNLDGWEEVGAGGRLKREGTYVYLWLIHIVLRQKPTQYCKATTFQLKISLKNLNLYMSIQSSIIHNSQKWQQFIYPAPVE